MVIWITLFAITVFLLAIAYAVLIGFYLRGWRRIPTWLAPRGWRPSTRITVIVPARNEAPNIKNCIESILSQAYPTELLQVIVVDDHSEDTTLQVLGSMDHPSLECFRLTGGSGKKAALGQGIFAARGELILTTDADCVVPPDWLALMVSYYEKHRPAFLAGPVCFSNEKNLFQRFQSLDYLGMMVLTGGGIAQRFTHLSNGANLAFQRAAFEEVGGYAGIDHLASGDDVLLMQKMARRYPGQIAFLKSAAATVRTEAKIGWRSFFRQRLRWAGKSSLYQDWRILPVTALVFLCCLSIPVGLVVSFWGGWPVGVLTAGLLLIKSSADYVLLRRGAVFFGRRDLLKIFWPAQFWHIAYIISVGLGSLVKIRYEWKGRRLR